VGGNIGYKIRQIQIPLAPLAEQHRIVAAIEALFARLDAASARLERVPGILKQFRQAVLATACDGGLTEDWRDNHKSVDMAQNLLQKILAERKLRYNEKGKNASRPLKNLEKVQIKCKDLPKLPSEWIWATWDDLVDWITYGFTRPMPHQDEGIPIVTAKNIQDNKIDFEHTHFTSKPDFDSLSDKDRPKKGEILLTKDGSIGRAAIVETDQPFCINQSVALLRFGGVTADAQFLLKVIESKFTQDLIQDGAKGTAIKHISITNFGKFPVPLPPLSEQHEIVRRVDALFALADRIEAEVAAAREKTEMMRQSILAQAFSGRLVPTEAELARREGREYEPASVLLERIHPEKKEKTGRRGVQSTLV